MGKIVAVVMWLLVIGTVLLFVGQQALLGDGRMWFPETISDIGKTIDEQFSRTLIVVGVAFVLSQVALGYVVFRFGRRGDERASYIHGSGKLEAVWTIVTAVVFITLAILAQVIWAKVHLKESSPDAVKVSVVAQQFQFNFHYPGADGVFGRTEPKFINDSSLNYVGLDPSDASGKDDIQTTTLVVPVDNPVDLTLRSKDVIHSLFIPALRFKQDTVPGLSIRMHFTARKAGKYEIPCAELCGQLHYNMKSFLLVIPKEEYQAMAAMSEDKFKERLTELLQQYPVSR
ncbi:MAG: cytochrome c oxidase subunit II [Acidobacteriota bacterium]